jgi:hypothetical protein
VNRAFGKIRFGVHWVRAAVRPAATGNMGI